MYGITLPVQMILGYFVFHLETLPYQELQRACKWRHASTSRVGKPPAHQFIGCDDETIQLSGVLLPEFAGSRLSLTMLSAMADTGKAWPLIQADGMLFGDYLIESIETTGTLHYQDGAPRRIDFRLGLKRDDSGELGDLIPDIAALL